MQTDVSVVRNLFCQKDQQLIILESEESTGTSTSRISPIKDPNLSRLDELQISQQSQDICLPFHILVFYFKNAKQGLISEMEKNFVDDLIVLSFNSLSIDSKFVCYVVRESDFIDILMIAIKESVDSLPEELDPVDIMGTFNLAEQIEEKSPMLLEQQMVDLVNNCRLIHQIFISLDI